jgi:hypothetical protein
VRTAEGYRVRVWIRFISGSAMWPQVSARPHNDHGLHTREPAIGRQIQGLPLALRLTLQRE